MRGCFPFPSFNHGSTRSTSHLRRFKSKDDVQGRVSTCTNGTSYYCTNRFLHCDESIVKDVVAGHALNLCSGVE